MPRTVLSCLLPLLLLIVSTAAAQPNIEVDVEEVVEIIQQQQPAVINGNVQIQVRGGQVQVKTLPVGPGRVTGIRSSEGEGSATTDSHSDAEGEKKKLTESEQARKTAGEIRTFLEERIKANPQDGPQAVTNLPVGVTLLLEAPGIGRYYSGTQRFYFACKLRVVNNRDEVLRLSRKQVRLLLAGAPQKIDKLPSNLQHYSYNAGNTSVRLQELDKAESVTLKPGETGTIGIVAPDMSGNPALPPTTIEVPLFGQTAVVDVRRHELGRLKLSTERLGPEGMLVLFTLRGQLNAVGWNVLLDEIETLNDNGEAGRFLVTWAEKAPQVTSEVQSWIQQAASQLGRFNDSTPSYRFPSNEIAALHWADIPNYRSGSSMPSYQGPVRMHKTIPEGVTAALLPILDTLPPQTIVKEIRVGDPQLRPAMLAVGSVRLGPGHLPLVMSYLDAEEAAVRVAAIRGLRHFAADEARERLLQTARDIEKSSAERLAAVDSLAASRFPQMGRALAELIADPEFKVTAGVVQALIRHPRAAWSPVIYDFLQTDPKEGAAEAVKALLELGHPDLGAYVRRVLSQQDENLRTHAFRLFVNEKDPEIRGELVRYTLDHLQKKPPTSEMIQLINETRDPRAVPLLLKHLRKKNGVNSSLINVLTEMGDARVAQTIREIYPRLEGYEQAQALQALWKLQSPDFLRLARSALKTKNSSLISYAANGLQAEASDEAVEILGEAFRESEYTSAWSYITNALAGIGTNAARGTLKKLQRETKNTQKRRYIYNALNSLYSRTPAYSAKYRTDEALKSKNFEQAIEMGEIGLKIDPGQPDLLEAVGQAKIELGKTAEGIELLERAVEQNLDDHVALSRLALGYVRDGQVDRGVKYAEEHKPRFKDESLYLYNTACVYGRAVEQAKQDDADEKLAQRADELTGKAIEYLKASKEKGFSDKNLVSQDPDLDPVRDHPDFEGIFGAVKPEREKPNL